jgi:hypothetical protein
MRYAKGGKEGRREGGKKAGSRRKGQSTDAYTDRARSEALK